MKYFIDHKYVDVNVKGAVNRTVLHNVVTNGEDDEQEVHSVIQYLIKNGIDINATDINGDTAYEVLESQNVWSDKLLQVIKPDDYDENLDEYEKKKKLKNVSSLSPKYNDSEHTQMQYPQHLNTKPI